MTRFRRRMRTVEALQFDGSVDSAHRLAAFSRGLSRTEHGLALRVARGVLSVEPGDWLMRDPETGDETVLTNAQFFRDTDHVALPGSPA